MSTQPPFTLTLQPLPGVDGVRGLRMLLKHALRSCGLRAIDITQHQDHLAGGRRTQLGVRQARRQEKIKMDMGKYSANVFLKFGDVKANGPLRVVITDVVEGKFGKPDLTFDDGTKLSVNGTNNRTLCQAYGTESGPWINKEIELFAGELKFNGAMQDAILVRPISPPIEKKKRKKPSSPTAPAKGKCGDMDDEIPY